MLATESSRACWEPGTSPPAFRPSEMVARIQQVRQPLHIIREETAGWIGLGCEGTVCTDGECRNASPYRLLASLPPLYLEWQSERSFLEKYKVRFAYGAGEMANGIATPPSSRGWR